MFVEAIVSALKPIWTKGEGMSVTEIVSIIVGVALAVAMKIDLFSYITDLNLLWNAPEWTYYIFYAMTGVAIGRGPSFIYDLWKALKAWSETPIIEAEDTEEK